MSMVNNAVYRLRGLTILHVQHEETSATMVLYVGARDIER